MLAHLSEEEVSKKTLTLRIWVLEPQP